MAEDWGCEFIDDGAYGSISKIKISSYLLPLKMVEKIVDEIYLREILLRDEEHIANLVASIQARGVQVPLLIVLDSQSIRLQDGNHRFLAARQLGLQYLPVEIVFVDEIKARSTKLKNFVLNIVEEKWLEES